MTNKDEITYINPFVRTTSAFIDIVIVAFLRIVLIELLGNLWLNKKIIEFYQAFNKKFGVAFSATNFDHQQFLLQDGIVVAFLFFIFLVLMVGALYHAYLNASTWSATVGKRIFKLVLVKNEGKSLTIWQALSHYFLSLIPWLFMVYILIYQAKNSVNLFTALTTNTTNLFLGVIVALWVNVHILTKKKNTVSDIISGCSLVRGKVGEGWPKIRK